MEESLLHLIEAKRQQIKMIDYRNYTLDPTENWLSTAQPSEVIERARTVGLSIRQLFDHEYLHKDGVRRLIVRYLTTERTRCIGKAIIERFVTLVDGGGYTDAVVIAAIALSRQARSTLSDLQMVNWQVFQELELQYCPIEHNDTPLHEVLSDDEAKDKQSEMKARSNQLSFIPSSDPVVKYYGWRVGDTLRITREDLTGSSMSRFKIGYRLIVDMRK
jgi:DNA-directed RNA polymerase subunit H (RpoH/RPB5)